MESGTSGGQNFCGKCGARVEKSTKFCTQCGEQLDNRGLTTNNMEMTPPRINPDYATSPMVSPVQTHFQFNPLYGIYNASNLLSGVKEAYSQKFSSIIVLFGSFYIFISTVAFFILRSIIAIYNLDSTSNDPIDQLFITLISTIIVSVLLAVMQFIPNSFLYRIIDNLETHRTESWVETIKYCMSRWPNFILYGLVIIGLFSGSILIIVGVFFMSIELMGIIIIPLFIALIYILLKIVSTPAYIIIDGMNVSDALSTSWNRMNGRIGAYFLASIVIAFIGGIMGAIVEIPLSYIIGDIGLIGLFIIPAFGQIIIGPLKSLLIISVYYLTKISLGETRNSQIFQKFTPYL